MDAQIKLALLELAKAILISGGTTCFTYEDVIAVAIELQKFIQE